MGVVTPYRPQANSISEAVYTYLSAERVVLTSMREAVVTWAHDALGSEWHLQVKNGPNSEGLEAWDEPGDAFYILKCLAKLPGSAISSALGPVGAIRPFAKRVFIARNQWSHYSNQLVMSSIKQDVKNLADFATQARLEVAEEVVEAVQALNKATALKPMGPAVAATRHQPVIETRSLPGAPKTAPTSAPTNGASQIPPRPRVGDPWTHDMPPEIWELNDKLDDVRSQATGESLRSRWQNPDEAELAMRRWFRRNLLPRVLHVDPRDGATVGFVEGHPYFVGYARESSSSMTGEIRGFYEPEVLELMNGDLVESETGAPAFSRWSHRDDLVQVLTEQGIEDGGVFRITDYGDVVRVGESGLKKVAMLPPAALQGLWANGSGG